MFGVELEPPSLRKVGRVENSVPPVRIVVAARAYEKTRFRSRVRSSEFGVQKHPVNGEMKLPAARDCVAIARKGERQSGSKALGCGSFRLCEIVICMKSNVFIPLARLISNG